MSEEVNRKNILAVADYSRANRAKLEVLEDILKKQIANIHQIRKENELLKEQIQKLQVKVFTGAATKED